MHLNRYLFRRIIRAFLPIPEHRVVLQVQPIYSQVLQKPRPRFLYLLSVLQLRKAYIQRLGLIPCLRHLPLPDIVIIMTNHLERDIHPPLLTSKGIEPISALFPQGTSLHQRVAWSYGLNHSHPSNQDHRTIDIGDSSFMKTQRHDPVMKKTRGMVLERSPQK